MQIHSEPVMKVMFFCLAWGAVIAFAAILEEFFASRKPKTGSGIYVVPRGVNRIHTDIRGGDGDDAA